MKNLFEQGKPRYGRFKIVPQCIDIKDFNYISPFKRHITVLKKNLRFKSFQFISLNNSQYMVGLAVVDLGWVGHGFFYCYDRQTGKVLEKSFLQPSGQHTHVCNHQVGSSSFKKSGFLIEIKKTAAGRLIKVRRGKHLLLDASIAIDDTEPLVLCSPTGVSGWTYTHKQTALKVTGSLYFNKKAIDLQSQQFVAALDDTCGMLRPETAWHWLSLSGVNSKGERLGINLASGVNETFVSENSLWLNGKIFELPAVLFERESKNQWRVYSADGRIKLSIQTHWRRHEAKNFVVVASQFNQWVSEVSGTILYQGQVINIDAQMSLLEQHYAKW
jgi:hypothetical protein